MISHILVICFVLYFIFPTVTGSISASGANNTDRKRHHQRQALGSNLAAAYYAFNPGYIGGHRDNIPVYQDNSNIGRPGTCRCSCADASFAPPIPCSHPQVCAAHCLQTYPARCTMVNTLGCCGSSCQYFQSQTLENRRCSCNCGGQQFFDPGDTCLSSESCLTRCLQNFPQVCVSSVMQACCGQNCISDSKSIAFAPTCQCNCGAKFSTLSPVPCQSGRSCLDACISLYDVCTPDNTQACCGNDCVDTSPSCTCMCGESQFPTIAMTCVKPQQCVHACLQSIAQCNVGNTRGCCGDVCSNYIPRCRCQCGRTIQHTTSLCASAEQCANTCIRQFPYVCTPMNTIGCCNGTFCTQRKSHLLINQTHQKQISYIAILFSMNYFLYDVIFFFFVHIVF